MNYFCQNILNWQIIDIQSLDKQKTPSYNRKFCKYNNYLQLNSVTKRSIYIFFKNFAIYK